MQLSQTGTHFTAGLGLVVGSVLCTVSASAQEASNVQTSSAPAENKLDGDTLTVGVGAIYLPTYRGSDDYTVMPIPLIRGRYKGVDINPRPAGLALDFIPDDRDKRVGFSLGPTVAYMGNRTGKIKDPVVRAAGKLDTAVEVGVNAGVTAYKVLHDYDSLTLSTDVRWDIAGAHKGRTISPVVSYATPFSPGTFGVLALSARHVDGNFARYNYSVTPEQSAASGLPGFRAKSGWDSVNVSFMGAVDLSGDLRDGGFQVFGVLNYSRMLNDGKRTPFTSIRGDADQWISGLGIAYTF